MQRNMGLLRIILALSVMIGHYIIIYPSSEIAELLPYLRGAGAISGAIKVNAFFVIAGFYTQLLLDEKFKKQTHATLKFYAYRALRLLPAFYILVVCYTLIVHFADINPLTRQFIIVGRMHTIGNALAHLFVFIPPLFDLPSGYFTLPESLKVAHYFVAPQLWALSNEVIFMLAAPFLCSSRTRLQASVIIALLLAIYYYHYGWVRNYMGATTIYFLCGCVCYKIYRNYLSHITRTHTHIALGYIGIAAITLLMLMFGKLATLMDPYHTYLLFMATFIVLLPFIAYATSFIDADRQIGELAYPIYLGHYLAFWVAVAVFNTTAFIPAFVLCIALGLVLAPITAKIRGRAKPLLG